MNDPFAPKSQAELEAEARALVQQGFGPLLEQIRKMFSDRSAQGQQAIIGATQALGSLWSGVGPASQQIYDTARGTEQSQATALASALGNFGQNLSGQEGQQLALQGAPAGLTAAITGGTAQTATGAANAGLASQTAESQMLNTQGAAAGAYGAKLPGIAGLQGLQHSRDLEKQLSDEMAQALGDANTQSGQQYTTYLQHLQDNELQKAEYRQSGLFKGQQAAANNKYRNQTLAYKKQQADYNRQLQRQRLGISKASVLERARHDGVSEAQAQARIVADHQKAAEHARHNQATETQARRNAAERARHNQQTEKNKGKGKGKGGKPWHGSH